MEQFIETFERYMNCSVFVTDFDDELKQRIKGLCLGVFAFGSIYGWNQRAKEQYKLEQEK
jgi:hypothetical protein